MRPIVIALTDEQDAAIQPFRDRLIALNKETGGVGMLLAQVYGHEIVVGIMLPDNAKKICEALGSPLLEHRYVDERDDVVRLNFEALR